MSVNKPMEKANNWKSQAYVAGALLGLFFGLTSAYLYGRAAEDTARTGGQPQRIQTMQLVGLALAALGVMRQIAELGRPARK